MEVGSTFGEIYRIPNQRLITGSMRKEFNLVIDSYFQDREWQGENWVITQYDTKEARQLSTSKECLCSHKIRRLCYITHVETGLCFLVGSDCMEKVSPTYVKRLEFLKERMKKVSPEKIQRKSDRVMKEIEKARETVEGKMKTRVQREFLRELRVRSGEIKLCLDCKVEIQGAEKWKTRCLHCYKKKVTARDPGEVFRCETCDCDITALRAKKGNFIKQCLECYYKK